MDASSLDPHATPSQPDVQLASWVIRPAGRYAFCCTLWWWVGAVVLGIGAWLGRDPAAGLLAEMGLEQAAGPIGWAVLGLIGLLVLIGGWKFLSIRSTRYELEGGQLRTSTGVLSRETEHLELYRVRDIGERRPFLLRLIGLGEVILHTADRSQGTQSLRGVSRPHRLAQDIRTQVEATRGRRGFVGLE
jgi:membrane protein YdbS with pleckstrin-like domain